MKTNRRVLFLIGSPKAGRSTSESMSNYIISRLQDRGLIAEKLHISKLLWDDKGRSGMLEATDGADTLILASPLYVDSLPYPTTKALELIAGHRRKKEHKDNKSFMAILNCGFPEAKHNNTALAICRLFAGEAGLRWDGGVGARYGGGRRGASRRKTWRDAKTCQKVT